MKYITKLDIEELYRLLDEKNDRAGLKDEKGIWTLSDEVDELLDSILPHSDAETCKDIIYSIISECKKVGFVRGFKVARNLLFDLPVDTVWDGEDKK